jgi:hypothetical protein
MTYIPPPTTDVCDMGNGLVMVGKTACWVSDETRYHEVERINNGQLETHRVYSRDRRATYCTCREHQRTRRDCIDMKAANELWKGW